MGDPARLAKIKAGTWKAKGTFHGMGVPLSYTGEWFMDGPEKSRVRIEHEVNGVKGSFAIVVNGDKGWVRIMDHTEELDKDRLADQKEEMYAGWVANLTPALDKAFSLTLLGEIRVDAKPAAGVKVSSKGHRDVNLYFDKASGLLVKTETRVKDDMKGMEVTQETFYSDYRDINGIQHAMKIVIKRDGQVYVEGETVEYRPAEKLDDAVFAKP